MCKNIDIRPSRTVRRCSYSIGNSNIRGYARPKYKTDITTTPEPSPSGYNDYTWNCIYFEVRKDINIKNRSELGNSCISIDSIDGKLKEFIKSEMNGLENITKHVKKQYKLHFGVDIDI